MAAAAFCCAQITPAAALPLPVSPKDPQVATLWENPDLRTVDRDSKVTMLAERIDGNKMILTLTNATMEPLSHISVRLQRGTEITELSAAHQALQDDQSKFNMTTPFRNLEFELGPEESKQVELEVDPKALQMDKPGVYPLLINVNGQLGQRGDSYLTSERMLFRVGELEKKNAPLAMVLPVTAETDIVPGETGEAPNAPKLLLQNDNLATQLTSQGRLTGLLEAYSKADPRTCLAIDPELVDTVARMQEGYRVSSERPNPTDARPRLRDSWFGGPTKNLGQEGAGEADAKRWIAQLKAIDAKGGCITALPWANADLNAVARTGNQAMMNEAVARGNLTLSRILGHPVRSNLVIPGQGYVDKRAAAAIGRVSMVDPELAFEVGADPGEWRVLVANNTLGDLAPNVHAVPFDASLGDLLAQLGQTTNTSGYANQWHRVDPRIDSSVARRLTAQNALALAVQGKDPVVVAPNADLSVEDARALIDASNSLYTSGHAHPISINDVPTRDQPGAAGSPYQDPAEMTDTEVLRASQQIKSIDDITSLMSNDPAIALSRYNFTNPLRQDLLRALSVSGRRSIATYDTSTRRADGVLSKNRETLQKLRASVALLPPGNVYTRTSTSSPLLIVAQNGLPLPVDAQLGFDGPDGARINVPEVLRIPARGSITTQMTADLPDNSGRTDLTVWLAAQSGAQISNPVAIGVQTRSGWLLISAVVAALFGLVGLLVFRQAKRRQAKVRRVKRAR